MLKKPNARVVLSSTWDWILKANDTPKVKGAPTLLVFNYYREIGFLLLGFNFEPKKRRMEL